MVNQRPRGILTASDRTLLRMDPEERKEEYSPPNRSQRWGKIEERVMNAILDLPILYSHLPAKNRSGSFGPVVETMWLWSPINVLNESFGFLLLGFIEQMDYDFDDEEVYETVFAKSIERAVTKHSGGAGAAAVEVDVTIDDWAPYDAIHEHEELADLQPAMLRSLLNAGEISDEEFAEAILSQSGTDEE